MTTSDILVVGAGIYGSTAAVELGRQGYSVTLIDPGPLPHPLAASTDISKVVRMEYGDDRQYIRLQIRPGAGQPGRGCGRGEGESLADKVRLAVAGSRDARRRGFTFLWEEVTIQ